MYAIPSGVIAGIVRHGCATNEPVRLGGTGTAPSELLVVRNMFAANSTLRLILIVSCNMKFIVLFRKFDMHTSISNSEYCIYSWYFTHMKYKITFKVKIEPTKVSCLESTL